MCPAQSISRCRDSSPRGRARCSGLSAHPVLIAESEAQSEEARLRLTRVGIEALDGYLEGGVAAWKQAGFAVATISRLLPPNWTRDSSPTQCRCSTCAASPSGMPGTSRTRTGGRWTTSKSRRRKSITSADRGPLQGRISQHDRQQPAAASRLQARGQLDRRFRCLAGGESARCQR